MRCIKRLQKLILLTVAMLLGVAVLVTAAGYAAMRASLPVLDGNLSVPGLAAPLRIDRDANGMPMISANGRADGSYALGFLHAQERFFQMDLLRRSAGGELAALLGEDALVEDLESRRFRFRAHARTAVANMDASSRVQLDRYTAGVNQGLQTLTVRPFEYLVLGAAPQAWQAEDSLLAIWSMYKVLQGDQERREFARGWLREHTNAAQLAWLLPESSRFDVPLDSSPIGAPFGETPLSGPAWLGRGTGTPSKPLRPAVGSNSWALAAGATGHGSAILANDMHLSLQLPNTWYRAAMHYSDGDTVRQVVGLTLPGVPLFVVGSNGKLAWGMTNSYGDFLDLIELEQHPIQPGRFKGANGWEQATLFNEKIEIKGRAPVVLKIRQTELGPVREVDGRNYAVHWIAQDAQAVNLRLMELESAGNIVQGASSAARAGIPAQNIMLVDVGGRIGWSIAGPLPDRQAGLAATFPYRVGTGAGWRHAMTESNYPKVLDPLDDALWSANSRQLGDAAYVKLGDGGADLGARAQQIRDELRRMRESREGEMMQLALDVTPRYMSEWRLLALNALNPSAIAGHPQRTEFRRLLLSAWDEQAGASSVGYRLTKSYQLAIYHELFGYVDEQLSAIIPDASFQLANGRWSEVALKLLRERPERWLEKDKSWHALELAAIDKAIERLCANGNRLADATWGKRNRAAIGHPFASTLPFGDRWLAAPPDPIPGDDDMPRVSAPDFGQSERLVVSPGRENEALFNMPGGQSGHPLSPFWLAGHAEWVEGKSQPLMPGRTRYRLIFRPKANVP